MKLIALFTLELIASASILRAAIPVPQASPYTSDANTILLEHFDNSVNGTLTGPLSYASGIFGQAGHFSTSTSLNWNSGSLSQGTFEFWASIESYASGAFPWVRLGFAHYSGLADAITFSVRVVEPAVHNPTFELNHAPFHWNSLQPAIAIGLNEWHHYATTWGGAGMRYYLDGSLVASNSDTGGINPSTQIWGLGSRSGYNEGLTGQMDEFRLSNIQREFSSVPEPASAVLLLVGAAFCIRRRSLRTHERNA